MIAKLHEFEKKLADLDLSVNQLAQAVRMHPNTLRRKLYNKDCDFSLAEAEYIANLMEMSEAEFLEIFFDKKLSFNES